MCVLRQSQVEFVELSLDEIGVHGVGEVMLEHVLQEIEFDTCFRVHVLPVRAPVVWRLRSLKICNAGHWWVGLRCKGRRGRCGMMGVADREVFLH